MSPFIFAISICFKMNPAKQTWVNINLVRLACYIVNDKFTPHTKLLILTENVQEIINSGFYLLKEVSLLRDNDGILSKINVNFHPFSLPLFRVFELRFSLLGHVSLRERTEFFNTWNYWKEKMELHVKGKITEPRFLFFNDRGPLRGFLKLPLSMVCQHTCPVCLVWDKWDTIIISTPLW